MSDTEEVIAALDRGEVRVAEPDGDDWRVNSDVQAAILDYFRLRQMEPREVGPFEYRDKIPLKTGYEALGVRVVPPATARYGAYLSPRRRADAVVREHRRLGRAEHDGRHLGDRRLGRADRRRRASRGRRRDRRSARAARVRAR